ncbi:hypothetical protein INR49_000169 [Caranx melampygus]|nr:hypothetical protein INR49_000169 [Caranx melampygus]
MHLSLRRSWATRFMLVNWSFGGKQRGYTVNGFCPQPEIILMGTGVDGEADKCCLKPLHQTAYPTAKTTIPCHVPDAESVKSWHKFLFMKKKGNICEDISSKGKFRFTETSHGFNLSISNVSSEDGGFQASKEKNKNTRDEGAQNNNEDLGYAEIHESPQRPDPETAPMTVYVTANFPTNISASMDRYEAQNISAEDYVYEEIHELRPTPESGNAMNSIYVTANCPTNPSASLHYSTINFHKAGGETPRPSSTGCEYSTVKFTQSPKTVIQPSPSTADALYSTVNKPQQQQQRNLIPGRDI